MAGDKVFLTIDKNDNEIELKFVKPTQRILTKGDFVYREYFGKSVRAGLLTNAEAKKLLKDREVWGESREQELIDIQDKIMDLEKEIKEIGKKDRGLKLYGDLKNLRTEIVELSDIRKSVMENSAESVAAEMRTQFYAAECVVYNKSGRKVFKGLEDFISRLDEQLTLDSYRQALIANYETIFGLDLSEVNEEKLAEDEWFESYKPVMKEKIEKVQKELKDEKELKAEKEVILVETKEKPKKKRRAKKKKTTTD